MAKQFVVLENGQYSSELVATARASLDAQKQFCIDVTEAPYNADPTGVADSAAAIQAAIDVAESNGGGIVFFPIGTYLINTGLTVEQSKILLYGSQNTIIKAGATMSYMITFDRGGSEGMRGGIRDLVIQGDEKANWAVKVDYWRYLDLDWLSLTGMVVGGFDFVADEGNSYHNHIHHCRQQAKSGGTDAGQYFARFTGNATNTMSDNIVEFCDITNLQNHGVAGNAYGIVLQNVNRHYIHKFFAGNNQSGADNSSFDGVVYIVTTDDCTTESGTHRIDTIFMEQDHDSPTVTATAVTVDSTGSKYCRYNIIENVSTNPSATRKQVHLKASGTANRTTFNIIRLYGRSITGSGNVTIDADVHRTSIFMDYADTTVSRAYVTDNGSETRYNYVKMAISSLADDATPSVLGTDQWIIGGTGDFVALGQTSRNWRGPAAAPNGNIYACVVGGDIYMQTGGTGDFVALGQTSRDWIGMAAAPNGNIYASVYGGDIYMQTGGTGDFVALSQTSRAWRGMAAAANGNIYACVSNGDIYMQTGGTGDFVALGQTSRDWRGPAAAPNGNIYASVYGGDIYMQTGGTTSITDFDDGYEGQQITVIADHPVTITDGTNIFLSGSANWTMTATDTLTLIQKADGKWYEISRGDNGA